MEKNNISKGNIPFAITSFPAAVTGWRWRTTLSLLSLPSVSTRHSKNVDKFRQLECSAVAIQRSSFFSPLSVCFGALVSHRLRLGNYTHPQEHTQTHAHTHGCRCEQTLRTRTSRSQVPRISCKQDLISTSCPDRSQVMLRLRGAVLPWCYFSHQQEN